MLKLHSAAFLAVASGMAACLFWIVTSQQPLIDLFEFRQTQTALTALFLQPGVQGLLNYETPVLGSPWAIPFEFPFYQWTVSLLARVSPLSLSSSGRLLSAAFGLACLWPAIGLMREFHINKFGQCWFAILYFTSSIYLYWNRSFMIESTALFFLLLSLYCYVLLRPSNFRPSPLSPGLHYLVILCFGLSLSLAVLVKVTTALPALILLGLDWIYQLKSVLSRRGSSRARELFSLLLLAACILAAGLFVRAWTGHADSLKQLNPFAKSLISQALNSWNYGTFSQRFSSELWSVVVIKRMFTPLALIPALGLLCGALLPPKTNLTQAKPSPADQQARGFVAASLFLAFAPPLTFSNLHIVHDYYQTANQIFLLLALASSASILISRSPKLLIQRLCLLSLALIVISNIVVFIGSTGYLNAALATSSDKLMLGEYLQQHTPKDSVILVDGDDWNSAVSFHSRRRSLTLPEWQKVFPNLESVLDQSASWLGGRALGAVATKKPLPGITAQRFKGVCQSEGEKKIGDWRVFLCQAQR